VLELQRPYPFGGQLRAKNRQVNEAGLPVSCFAQYNVRPTTIMAANLRAALRPIMPRWILRHDGGPCWTPGGPTLGAYSRSHATCPAKKKNGCEAVEGGRDLFIRQRPIFACGRIRARAGWT